MKNLSTESKGSHIQKALKEQLYTHRNNLNLKQAEVARMLDKSEKTYQRWESTGNGLSNIQDILKLFEVLEFSTSTVIKLLNLPPLTYDEIRDIVTDIHTLKSIKEEGVYSHIRNNCSNMDNVTIEKLLVILQTEHLERYNRRFKR